MPEQPDHPSPDREPHKPSVKEMMWHSNEFDPKSEQHYSGDGTWTESRVICALIDASSEDEALAKAAAAFANRTDRADPLFAHQKTDTFELAIELESLPLAVAESGWEKHPPTAKLSSDGGQEAVERAIADSDFSDSDAIIYNEWGDKFASEARVREHVEDIGNTGWFILGLALEPTGSGKGHDEYIGNNYQVECPECYELGAKCVNIVFESRAEEHIGIWDCDSCSSGFRGPHPQSVIDVGYENTP